MGLRYVVMAFHYDDDQVEPPAGSVVGGDEARDLGIRLGLGVPSDETGLGIWYAE